jgi:holo-[acyl-carrier protein] synthase
VTSRGKLQEHEQSISPKIGVDIENIQRFRGLSRRSPFVQRVYSENELNYCFAFTDPSPHLASTFCAKEAVIKATKDTSLPPKSIEIHRGASGAPEAILRNAPNIEVLVSMSHTLELAVAVALLLSPQERSSVSQTMLDDVTQQVLSEVNLSQ